MSVDIRDWLHKHLPGGKETASGWYRVSCAFHREITPSFAVNLQSGSFGCKAASCGKHGGFARLMIHVEGITWEEAFKRLGVSNPFSVDDDPFSQSPSDRASRPTINPLPSGMVPVAPSRFPPYLGDVRGYTAEDAQAFGLCFGADTSAGRLRNFLVFPFWDFSGTYRTYTARKMSTQKGLRYLQPEQGLAAQLPYGIWRFAALQELRRFFVCEGPFDVMRMWKLGLPAVGISTTKTTPAQRRQIAELSVQFGADVCVLLDNGENEDRMSNELVGQLSVLGIKNAYSGSLPEGVKDPDCLTPETVKILLDTLDEMV